MKTGWIFVFNLLLSLPALAQLEVSNNPTGAAVVITQPSAVLVTWSVRGANNAPVQAVSDEGLFVLNDQVLGRVETDLTATNGTVPETLLIPPDVTNRALKLNAPTFFYQRTFRSSDGATGQSALTCRVSTSAYGNFSIAAVTLFFKNQRGEATFEQNQKNVQAFAEVHYNGSGLLKAEWEVQEPGTLEFRTLQQVNYHITYGDKIVFESPTIPPLPTVVTGRHKLRFHILQPISGFELPDITYFVKGVDPEERLVQEVFSSVLPVPEARITPQTLFQWTHGGKPALLKFSVYEEAVLDSVLDSPSRDPLANSPNRFYPVKGVLVFSAILPAGSVSYVLKQEQIKRIQAGRSYLWQIQALDSQGKVTTESELRSFRFSEPQIESQR